MDGFEEKFFLSMTVAQGLPRSQARSRTARHGGQRLRAPFPLRCGALLIDYIALVSLVVLGTLVSRMLGVAGVPPEVLLKLPESFSLS